MARWLNHSGSTVNVPLVGRDVNDGEEIEVPDDAILPANYFSVVGEPAADSAAASDASFGVDVVGEE